MIYFIFVLTIPILLSTLIQLDLHRKTAQFFAQTHHRSAQNYPPISILVPVRGLDQDAEKNYLSLVQQNYPSPFEIIFALEEDTDPAISAIQLLIANHPDIAIQCVISDGVPGTGKIKNQIAAAQSCHYDLWVLIDSDVRLEPDFLKSQAAWLAERPDVGLAYAPPIAVGAQDWVAALHNISVSASLMNYCRAKEKGNLNAVVGSCIVTRKEVMEAIGGLESIAHRVVGLDVSLGQAVTQAHYKIELLQQPARIHHERDTLERYWWQIHRWLTTINHYFPKFWIVGLIIGVPIWWALLFLLITLMIDHFQIIGVLLLVFTISIEILSAGIINLTISKDNSLWKYLWIAPLRQIVTFPLLILSRTSRQVKWRGRWLSIETLAQ